MATLRVWNFGAFEMLLESEGVRLGPTELKKVTEIFGIHVIPTLGLPDGRCEVIDPVTGKVLLAFDLK